MFTSCTHTLESGKTCESPAVRGTSLCFHHTSHETIARRPHQEYEPFELPNIFSKNGILVAIAEILHRLAMRRIKRSEADTLLRGLSFATRIMSELDQEIAAYGVHESSGASTAPEESSSRSIEEMVNSITADLGGPTFKEIEKLRADMPNATPQAALQHWMACQKSRPANGATLSRSSISS
jgi:hypothetical protein